MAVQDCSLAAVRVRCWAMKYLALSLTIVSTVLLGSLSVARAETMPVEGTRELRLGNSVGVYSFLGGTGINALSPEHGSSITTVSMSAGLGYFLAEHVEAGGTVGFFYFGSGFLSSSSMKGPTFSVFLRLYSKVQNVGIFFEPTVEYQYLSASNASLNALGPGADVGIEVFLADSWALRLSPTFRYYKIWEKDADTSFTKFGLTWGISAYF
jgi:hypothetical protein